MRGCLARRRRLHRNGSGRSSRTDRRQPELDRAQNHRQPAAPGRASIHSSPWQPSWRLTEQEVVESRNTQPDSIRMSTCDYRFKPGRQYLIYAGRAADGRWTTSWCSGTKPIEAAAADLDYIASIALARPTGRIYGNVERTTVDPSSGLSPMPAPAAGVRVALISGSKKRFIKTDADGRINAQVPPGDYTVAPVVPDNVLVSGSPARVLVPPKGCAAVQFSLISKELSVRP